MTTKWWKKDTWDFLADAMRFLARSGVLGSLVVVSWTFLWFVWRCSILLMDYLSATIFS